MAKEIAGDGEMAQWFRVHAVLIKDPSSVPGTHMSQTFVPRNPMLSSGLLGYQAHMQYNIYTHAKESPHKIKSNSGDMKKY